MWRTAKPRHYGYAKVLGGASTVAHRVAYVLAKGQPPANKPYVCHKCDNPRCVRPSHLFAGSASDNGKDRADKVSAGQLASEHPPEPVNFPPGSCSAALGKLAEFVRRRAFALRDVPTQIDIERLIERATAHREVTLFDALVIERWTGGLVSVGDWLDDWANRDIEETGMAQRRVPREDDR